MEETLEFKSNRSGESVSYTFNGSQVIVLGTSDCHSGYADFLIYDEMGELIHTAVVDFYSLVPDTILDMFHQRSKQEFIFSKLL